MAYKFGETRAAQEAREAEERARAKLAELKRLEAQIEARLKAAREQAVKIKPLPTYKPTPETLAYHEQRVASNPNPFNETPWHGYKRLKEATAEAAAYDRRKNHAA